MGRIWSEQRRYETWLQVELAATDSMAAAGIVPADIRTLDDFRRLPIVSKTDIDADLIANPPFGSYQGPAVDQGRVARVHASSGTTGDPRPILCTLDDVHRVAQLSARRLRAQGVIGKWVEFHGPGARALRLQDRSTLSNMSPEYGATMEIGRAHV